MTQNVECPYCEKEGHTVTVLYLDENVKMAHGSVKCWSCKRAFGWFLKDGKIYRLW